MGVYFLTSTSKSIVDFGTSLIFINVPKHGAVGYGTKAFKVLIRILPGNRRY